MKVAHVGSLRYVTMIKGKKKHVVLFLFCFDSGTIEEEEWKDCKRKRTKMSMVSK